MADRACIYDPNGQLVYAGHDDFDKAASFYCQYQGCNARMHIVSPNNSQEHFRSYHISDHAFSYCIRQDVVFYPDKYDEKLFRVNYFFHDLLHTDKEEQNIHNGHHSGGNVGHNQGIPIRTLKTIYAAMLHVGIGGTYGDMVVDDYLCCADNYTKYRNGFTGNKIVELTYARKVYGRGIRDIEFCYPYYNGKISTKVLVHFKQDKDFWHVYDHYKGKLGKQVELEPLIIAAVWRKPASSAYIAECDIERPKQHVYVQQ